MSRHPQPTAHATLQEAILVFDEVEVLDLGGPYEAFTTASRMLGTP